HGGDLRNPLGGHDRLVVEDPAEMLLVGKHLGLERKEDAARVDQVDRGHPVLERDLLRADVLLDRGGVVGPALHRGVVRDDHALAPGDHAHAGHDPRGWDLVIVEAARRQGRELEERGVGIEKALDPLARQELPPAPVELDRLLRAAPPDRLEALLQIARQGLMVLPIGLKFGALRLQVALQDAHGLVTLTAPAAKGKQRRSEPIRLENAPGIADTKANRSTKVIGGGKSAMSSPHVHVTQSQYDRKTWWLLGLA